MGTVLLREGCLRLSQLSADQLVASLGRWGTTPSNDLLSVVAVAPPITRSCVRPQATAKHCGERPHLEHGSLYEPRVVYGPLAPTFVSGPAL